MESDERMGGMAAKKSFHIDYYNIEGSPGGNQDWCKDFWMNLGGCAALAAGDMAICLSKNYGLKDCCPYDPDSMTKKDYDEYAMILKPYIRPRFNGVTRLSIFTEGFRHYLMDRGYEPEYELCVGREDPGKAEQFIIEALSRNLPVACLILSHRDPGLKDLNWHWFSLTGYEYKEERFRVIYHTYGEKLAVDFEKLWNTGSPLRGGLVALKAVNKIRKG